MGAIAGIVIGHSDFQSVWSSRIEQSISVPGEPTVTTAPDRESATKKSVPMTFPDKSTAKVPAEKVADAIRQAGEGWSMDGRAGWHAGDYPARSRT